VHDAASRTKLASEIIAGQSLNARLQSRRCCESNDRVTRPSRASYATVARIDLTWLFVATSDATAQTDFLRNWLTRSRAVARWSKFVFAPTPHIERSAEVRARRRLSWSFLLRSYVFAMERATALNRIDGRRACGRA